MTPVYWLETRLPAPFRYRYVSCLSSVRRLLCSKGYLGRPVAIVWDMWRVLPALSNVTRLTRLSRERTVRTAVQRLGRRWPILLPGRVWVRLLFLRVRARPRGLNVFSPINTLQHPRGRTREFGYSPSRIGESHPGHIAWVLRVTAGLRQTRPRIPSGRPGNPSRIG